MALSRTAMPETVCRSLSNNGQTADRHPVCPSAVWPFLCIGSRRRGVNSALWFVLCVEEFAQVGQKIESKQHAVNDRGVFVPEHPRLSVEQGGKHRHGATEQSALRRSSMRLCFEKGNKRSFRLLLSEAPRVCRRQCDRSFRSKCLGLLPIRIYKALCR